MCRLEAELLDSLTQNSTFIEASKSSDDTSTFVPKFQSAIGELNEVQIVFQQAFESLPDSSLDQIEILHTDYSTYVSLLHEQIMEQLKSTFNDIDDLPITFGEGLACIYSRPGRALRSWLRWIRSEFSQASMVKIIREGLISFDSDQDEVAIGFSGLAHRFRKLPIGFGRDRYSVILSDAVASAKQNIEVRAAKVEESDHKPLSQGYDFGLGGFEKLHNVLDAIIAVSPEPNQPAIELLEAAAKFLNQFARSVNKFDNYAKAKLIDDIRTMQIAIAESPEQELDVWDWLENLPVDSRILAKGPRPGCIHVDHVAKGGHSGRTKTFILGLDDSRFPYRGGQDPLLLDFERQSISENLETSGTRNVRSREDFRELLSRLNGTVTFTFATQSLSADREQYPSSALLELYRDISEKPSASMDDFLAYVGTPQSFCNDGDSFTTRTPMVAGNFGCRT